jgi:hypothetical protein
VTRRVPPLLVTSNTIFDVARRGKTFLVTPNINVAASNTGPSIRPPVTDYAYMAHDDNNGDT